jgi:plastocyanin
MGNSSKEVRATLNLLELALTLSVFLLVSCSKPTLVPDSKILHKTHVITINKFQFTPETLVIRAGDFVKWKNKDIVPHLIADRTLKEWRSKDLLPNDSFILQIKKTTSYICKFHPTMKAKIITREGN